MRSKLVIFISMMWSGGWLFSQSAVSPALLTWGGGSADVAGGVVDWSLGQMAINTGSLSGDLVTQGFHQPEFTLVGTEDFAGYKIKVFPNPASGHLQIMSSGDHDITGYEIIDMQGHEIDKALVGDQKSVMLSVSALAPGYYVLRVFLGDAVVHAVFCRN